MPKDDQPQTTRDVALIDSSLEHLQLVSDRELEALAGLALNTLSKARQGAQPLSGFAIAKIMDLRGYKWATDALYHLFGDKGRAWIASEDRRRKRNALKRLTGRDVDAAET